MSVVLNGTTQYLALAEALAQAEPITIVAFFKSNDITLDHTLVSMCSSSSNVNYFTLSIRGDQANDPIFANARSSSKNAWALTSSGYNANTWYHAAARFEIINKRYANIDGGSEGEDTNTVNPSFLHRMAIGVLYRQTLAAYMAGKIAEVAVWDKYLTDAELVSLAGGAYPSDVQSGNLLAYWPLYDDAEDDSGNAKHLTPVGSPSYDTADHPTMDGGGVVMVARHYYNHLLAG